MPAIPFFLIVKQYAQAKGLKFFTWKDQQIAINIYMERRL